MWVCTCVWACEDVCVYARVCDCVGVYIERTCLRVCKYVYRLCIFAVWMCTSACVMCLRGVFKVCAPECDVILPISSESC